MSEQYVTQAELVASVAELSQEINSLLAGLEALRPQQGEYITNQEAVDLVNRTIDEWHDLLWDTLMKITALVDDINGEVVYDNLVKKLEYLKETKRRIREAIGDVMPDGLPFRLYPDYIGQGGPGVIIPLIVNGPGIYTAVTYEADGFDPVTATGYTPRIEVNGVDRNTIPFNIQVSLVSNT